MLQNKQKSISIPSSEHSGFRVQDTIRSRSVGFLFVKLLFASSTLFYLFPIIMAVHNNLQVASVLIIVFTEVDSFMGIVRSVALNPFPAATVAGCFLLVLLLEGVLLKLLASKGEKGEEHFNLKKVFSLLTLGLFMFLQLLSQIISVVLAAQLQLNFIVSFVCLAILIVLHLFGYWMETVLTSVDLNADSCLTKVRYQHDGVLRVVKMLVSNACLVLPQGNIFILAGLVILALVINAFELYRLLYSVKYYHEQTANLSKTTVVLEFVLLLECLLVFLFPVDILADNFDILSIAVFILSLQAVHKFLKERLRVLLSEGLSELHNEKDAGVYVMELLRVVCLKKKSDISKSFFVMKHFRECSSIDCFCSAADEEDPFVLAKNLRFTNTLLLDSIERVKNKFSSSLWLFGLYLHLKLKQDPGFSRAKHRLKYLVEGKVELSAPEKYLIHQLEIMIERHLKNATMKGHLALERVIAEEKVMDTLKGLFAALTQENLKKYKMISQEVVRLNEVASVSDRINQNIRAIEEIWSKHATSDSQNTALDALFFFYFKNLVPSQLQAKKITMVILEKIRKFGRLQMKKNKMLIMYSPKACVLESTFDETLGKITNSSVSVLTALGVGKHQILGEDIHKFMPSFYALGHEKRVKKWLSDESFELGKGSFKESVTVDCQGIAFSCTVTLKFHSDGSVLKVYKLVIRNNDRDYLILDNKHEIQGIGRNLLEQGIFSFSVLHQNLNALAERIDVTSFPERGELRETLVRRIAASKDNKDGQESTFQNEVVRFECRCLTKQIQIGDVPYYAMFFEEIKKGESLRDALSKNLEPTREFNSMLGVVNKEQSSQHTLMFQPSSSCQTLLDDQKTRYSKLMIYLKQKLCHPQHIIPYKFYCASATLFISFVIIVFALVGFKYSFEVGLASVGSIVSAGNAVADQNQLLEFLYSNALMSQTYCGSNEERCSYLLSSSERLLHQFYSEYTTQFGAFFSERSDLSSMCLLGELNTQVNLTFKGQQLPISSGEFLYNQYYWMREVITSRAGVESSHDMEMLLQNWKSLVGQNRKASTFYWENGNKERFLALVYVVVFNCLITVGISISMGGLNYFWQCQQKSKIIVLNVYQNISQAVAKVFLDYFTRLNKELTYCKPEDFPSPEVQRTHKGIQEYQPHSNHNMVQGLLMLLGSPLLIIAIIATVNMYAITKNTIDANFNLRTAQRKLFQNFYSLKTFYLTPNYSQPETQIRKNIIEELSLSQVQFTKTIKETISLFQSTNPTFEAEINDLLTKEVCELIAKNFQAEKQECLTSKHFHILDHGIIAGLNLFQRDIFIALEDLSKLPESSRKDYLQSKFIQGMDDYGIIMFRVFSLITDRIFMAFEDGSSSLNNWVTFIVYLCLFNNVMAIIFWCKIKRNEQQKSSYLYGYVLQLPESVLSKKHLLVGLDKFLVLAQK